jgi:hypothetical protein
MPSDRSKAPLQAATVEDLLRIQGFSSMDDAIKTPIAVGGASAVAAVVAARQGSIFDTDPASYLSELDRLAGPDEP